MAGVHVTPKTRTLTINVEAENYLRHEVNPEDAAAEIVFNSSGSVTVISDTGVPYNWLVRGVNTGLEINFDTVTGALTSGTESTWLTLDTDQIAGVARTTIGTSTWTGTIRIRRASDMVELDSAAVTITATIESDA